MDILNFSSRPHVDILRIATLGPAGTSSEQSALSYGEQTVSDGLADRFEVVLCQSYEDASDQIRSGECQVMLVANAYAGINEFYMDQHMQLSSAFIKQTPNYGIAIRGSDLKRRARIATHPAPRALIRQLMPQDTEVESIVLKPSTSVAAKAVSDGEVDAALTTEVAAVIYGLTFVSPVRPIRMLWSVFTAA